MNVPIHAGTAHHGLLQKRQEEDLWWIVPHKYSPRRPNRSGDWTVRRNADGIFVRISEWTYHCRLYSVGVTAQADYWCRFSVFRMTEIRRHSWTEALLCDEAVTEKECIFRDSYRANQPSVFFFFLVIFIALITLMYFCDSHSHNAYHQSCLSFVVPAGSFSHGRDVTVYVWHTPTELAHSFLFYSCVCFCLYGPFNCISFHKFSRRLSVFSLCSAGLIPALLALSTVYFLMKVYLIPDS